MRNDVTDYSVGIFLFYFSYGEIFIFYAKMVC